MVTKLLQKIVLFQLLGVNILKFPVKLPLPHVDAAQIRELNAYF